MEAGLDPSVVDQEWPNLLDGLVDEPLRGRLLASVAEGVNSAMGGEYGTSDLLDALNRTLGVSLLFGAMWRDVDRCVGLTLGRDGVRLLTWLVVADNEIEERLNEIASALTTEAAALFRRILTLHGDRLARAYYMWLFVSADDDWRSVDCEMTQAVGADRYSMRVRLKKFNGEEIVLTGRPDSMIILLRVIAEVVGTAPPAAFGNRADMEQLQQAKQILTGKISEANESAAPEATGDIPDRATVDGKLPSGR